jgi:hypothetical protein
MKYRKQPHSRLHHIETHRHDDGSYQVQVHVVHRPPPPPGQGKNKSSDQIAFAKPHDFDYPNRVIKLGAADWDEATKAHQEVLAAHQHEGGKRKPHVAEADYEHISE